MKFGVSPFGIWANKYQHPDGSNTHGGSSYFENYADARKWMKEGWVDYVAPQLYWSINSRAAGFDTLINWWSNNTYNRHLYIGQAVYRIAESRKASAAFHLRSELPNELQHLRVNPRIQGSIFFSSNSLINNFGSFTDSLREKYYLYPALPPVMLWLDAVSPNPPQNVLAKLIDNRAQLSWLPPLPAKDKEPVYGYIIYRFEGNEKIDISGPEHIIHIQYNTQTYYEDNTLQKGKNYLYIVTAIDRLKNESDRSPAVAAILP